MTAQSAFSNPIDALRDGDLILPSHPECVDPSPAGPPRHATLTFDRGLTLIARSHRIGELCPVAAAAENTYPPLCQRVCLGVLREALATGEIALRSITCRHGSEERFLRLQAIPLPETPAAPSGVLLVLQPDDTDRRAVEALTGCSPRIRELQSLIDLYANLDAPLLITGEAGCGKSYLAQLIHAGGRRRETRLLTLDCRDLSARDFERVVFGSEGGQGQSLLSRLDGGTLLLENVDSLAEPSQTRLLHLLQKSGTAPGGRTLNGRLMATSRNDLLQKVREGTLLSALFSRLKTLHVDLPPLRRRREDLPLLLEENRLRFNRQHGRAIERFSEDALLAMLRYDWPGNLCEFENAVEHAAILCHAPVAGCEHLPPELRLPGYSGRYVRREEVDGYREICDALIRSGGNKAKAARLIGMSRQTLYRKISEYGIDEAAFVSPST